MDKNIVLALGARNWTKPQRDAWDTATLFRQLATRRFHVRVAYPGECGFANIVITDLANRFIIYALQVADTKTTLAWDDENLHRLLVQRGYAV